MGTDDARRREGDPERAPEEEDTERRPEHRFAADEEVRDGAAGDTPARTPGQGA